MSLVLTELTDAGIAMATDTAISMLLNGKISTIDQQQWRKLLKVPRIFAALSYWGSIGHISKSERFDDWLERRIRDGKYSDLPTFADYLAAEMNNACGNKPLPDGQPAGIHVAGFHSWPDGIRRPTFFHIHNGHGGAKFEQKAVTTNGQTSVEINPRYDWDQRELFSRHNDFPPDGANYVACVNLLANQGYMTRNGDYAPFVIISNGLAQICGTLNAIPGVSVPRRSGELGARVGFLHMVMETVINIYKCSSMSKVIGGKVMTLGIKPDGTYL